MREVEDSKEVIAGRYRVQSELARGGMGRVYDVVDGRSGRRLALKRMSIKGGRAEVMRAMFAREFAVLRGLAHPRIVEVYEYGLVDGDPYYTMELVEGRDLASVSPLPYSRAASLLRDIAWSLSLLETRGLVHRDISPRNVRVTGDGRGKLLDFGALTGFGVATNVVGTPPCVPPEALRGGALDQRSDLYSLGATAYHALTGRHAYPARSIGELSPLWAGRLPPPSALCPGIPAGLDDLVLSLLERNPLARPQHAAEVIERLNSVADRVDEPDARAAQSYFVGTGLVGREGELARIDEAIGRAIATQGSALVIEAPRGLGRSRLLDEACLQAELRGATVVQLDARLEPGIEGLASIVAQRLRVAGSLAATAEGPPAAHWSDDQAVPGERLARVQVALLNCVRSAGERGPLVVAVDNLDAADEQTQAAVSTLAARAADLRILVIVTATVSQGAAAALLLRSAEVLRPAPLTPLQSTDLVRAMFGNVDNAMRLGEWMHGLTGGNLVLAYELSRELVSRGTVRYAGGSWTLPVTAELSSLPVAIADALSGRLATMDADTQALAEALSLHDAPLGFPVCYALARELGIGEAFPALQSLVDAGVIHAVGDQYCYRHEVLRSHMREALQARRRAELHGVLARALVSVAAEDDSMALLSAGFHMLQGGDELCGARQLAQAALALETGSGSLQAAVPALEEAHRIYRREGASDYELLPIVARLASEGYFSDWRLCSRYGPEAFAMFHRALGLDVIAKLGPWLGGRLAVPMGLGVAAARYYRVARKRRPIPFEEVFVLMVNGVTTHAAAAAVCLDGPAADQAVDFLAPLTALGDGHLFSVVHDYCMRLSQLCRDQQHEAAQGFRRLVAIMRDPTQVTELPAYARASYEGGALFALGTLATWRDGHEALMWAEQLEALGMRVDDRAADQVRMFYHAGRGEMALAEKYRREMELHAIATGAAWQVEVTVPTMSTVIYAIVGDVLGLKRATEQCEVLAERYGIESLRCAAACGRAACLLYSGNAEAAIAAYEEVLVGVVPRSFVGWARAHGELAEAYNRVGRHDRALATCLEALAHCTAEDRPYVRMFLCLDIQLALAEAGLGQITSAIARLQALLIEHAPLDNPLTLGELHEALAVVAFEAGDKLLFLEHAGSTDRLFRATGAASLVGRAEALARRGDQAIRVTTEEIFSNGDGLGGCETTDFGLAEDTSGRQQALEFLVRRGGLSEAHLFAIGPTGPRVVASSHVTTEALLSRAAELVTEGGRQGKGEFVAAPGSTLPEAELETDIGTQTLCPAELGEQDEYFWRHFLAQDEHRTVIGLLAFRRGHPLFSPNLGAANEPLGGAAKTYDPKAARPSEACPRPSDERY